MVGVRVLRLILIYLGVLSIRGFGHPPTSEDMVFGLILHRNCQAGGKYLKMSMLGAVKPPDTTAAFEQ